MAALLHMKFIFGAKKKKKKRKQHLQALLSSCRVIYVKLLVARRNRSRFAHVYYRKGIIDHSLGPSGALAALLLILPRV